MPFAQHDIVGAHFHITAFHGRIIERNAFTLQIFYALGHSTFQIGRTNNRFVEITGGVSEGDTLSVADLKPPDPERTGGGVPGLQGGA